MCYGSYLRSFILSLFFCFIKDLAKRVLFVWIGFATVCANLQVVKTVELFGLTATLGNIMYGTVFFATDVLNEKYGPGKRAKPSGSGFPLCSL